MCRVIGATPTPASTSRSTSSGVNGLAGAGHLGAAGAGGEDRLVVGQRVPAVQVAVGDRPAHAGAGWRDRPARSPVEPRPPEPVAATGRAGIRRAGRARAGAACTPSGSWTTSPAPAVQDRCSWRPVRCAVRRPRSRRRGRWPGAPRPAGRPASRPSSSAGNVAELLTTSRSPDRRWLGQVAERGVWRCPCGAATSSRTSSRRSPRCSGGSVAVRSSGRSEGGGSGSPARRSCRAATCRLNGAGPGPRRRQPARYRPLGGLPGDQIAAGRAPRRRVSGGR